MFGIFSLLLPIAQLVLRISKTAGWLMIASPVFTIITFAVTMLAVSGLSSISSGPNYTYMILALIPAFGQVLFFAGVFIILLQAKALKKRAEEQQMLLDDITSRQ
jgi:vacuolar-type H+-ATPase subunit I/STV1